MIDENFKVPQVLEKATHIAEGVTSLIAGSYVLSLALTKDNLLVKVAFGVAGAYLILRSGTKLRAANF